MNSYFKRKLIWYKAGSTAPITITEGIQSVNTNKNTKPTTNKCTVVMDNLDLFYTLDGIFLPKEGDIMVVYEKEVTSNSNTDFTDSDVIWTGRFLDRSIQQSGESDILKLSIADWMYDVFSRFWAQSYVGRGKRTNEVIIDVLSNQCESFSGDGSYKLNFDNVATHRNDNSLFPVIEPTLINKPTHEWINELGTPQWTNAVSEVVPIVKENMVFDIRGTNVYWYEKSDTSVLTIDKDTTIHSITTSSKKESSVNFLIIEAGQDFNGEPIYWYAVDPESGGEIIKETYQNPFTIAGKNTTYDNSYHSLRNQYNLSTNAAFIAKVIELVKSYSSYWFQEYGRSKDVISVTLDKTLVNIGDTVLVNLYKHSINTKYIIDGINNRSSESESSTTIDLIQKV